MRRLMKALRRWRNKRKGKLRGISKLPEGWDEPYLRVFREADEFRIEEDE